MTTLAERLELAMQGPPEIKSAELARACGVKAPSVSDWLSGKTKKMEGANLLSAALALNVDPWWLATGEGRMERRSESASPHREVTLRPSAQALIDVVTQADREGLADETFAALAGVIKTVIPPKAPKPRFKSEGSGQSIEELEAAHETPEVTQKRRNSAA